jgi:predicted GH43/DUF377 family glycosyl hydrolase
MNWKKKGLIFSTTNLNFGQYRVMCPTPILVDNCIRVFCGFSNNDGISRVGYVDLDPENPSIILNYTKTPVLDIGDDGMFDDNGLCPTSIINDGNKILMYYFGFQLGVKIPFFMFSGRAESYDNGKTWTRTQNTPVIDRSASEPIMRSGPFVFMDNGIYKVYYPCGTKFININGKLIHTYKIYYMESNDWINWPKEGVPVIDFIDNDEFGFGRPYVFIDGHFYHMLYSIRTKSKGYRLGNAISVDGISWTRLDNLKGLELGAENSWDSEMLCYSSTLRVNEKFYLFYNGNNLGSSGFGYAELIDF